MSTPLLGEVLVHNPATPMVRDLMKMVEGTSVGGASVGLLVNTMGINPPETMVGAENVRGETLIFNAMGHPVCPGEESFLGRWLHSDAVIFNEADDGILAKGTIQMVLTNSHLRCSVGIGSVAGETDDEAIKLTIRNFYIFTIPLVTVNRVKGNKNESIVGSRDFVINGGVVSRASGDFIPNWRSGTAVFNSDVATGVMTARLGSSDPEVSRAAEVHKSTDFAAVFKSRKIGVFDLR